MTRGLCLIASDALRGVAGLILAPLVIALVVVYGVGQVAEQILHPAEWPINPTFRDWGDDE